MKPSKQEMDELTRKLVDAGKLIEAGWYSYTITVMPEDASKIQVDETRNAFFAGAQHLYASVMGMMEEGAEPTMNDLRRMASVDTELNQFVDQMKAKMQSGGQA